MSAITEKAASVFAALSAVSAYELVDVEYVSEEGQMCLNFYIHAPGGIGLADCETVSRALEGPLEEEDVTQGKPYCLCVSSPGDRPLKTERDFARNIGCEVELFLKEGGGPKRPVGELLSFTETEVQLAGKKGPDTYQRENIKKIRPYIGFNGRKKK